MTPIVKYAPNALTLARVGLAVLVFVEIIATDFLSALLLYLLALTTDFLDGAIARKYDARTEIGERVLETLADTTLVILTGLGLAVHYQIPPGYFVIFVVLVGLYFTIVKRLKAKRLIQFLQALEPTLDGVCIFLLAVWLSRLASGSWLVLTLLFFAVAAITKYNRIRAHLSHWKKVGG